MQMQIQAASGFFFSCSEMLCLSISSCVAI
jgi:hypothetical protein